MLKGGAGREALLERCWAVPAAAGLLEGSGATLWGKMAPTLAQDWSGKPAVHEHRCCSEQCC